MNPGDLLIRAQPLVYLIYDVMNPRFDLLLGKVILRNPVLVGINKAFDFLSHCLPFRYIASNKDLVYFIKELELVFDFFRIDILATFGDDDILYSARKV